MPYLGVTPSTAASADLDGKELILDADADTTITADTDDQIDIRIAGADDFQFTANTLTALSGSTIATNTIAETTGGSGVTIDGLLIKDTTAAFADGAVTTPSITNTGDLNTGVYFPAADTVGITAGGTEQFRFGSNPIPGGQKNMLINGAFTISQRGASFAISPNASGSDSDYTLDRWFLFAYLTDSDYTVTQETLTPGTDEPYDHGFRNSIKVDCTTSATPAGSDTLALSQKLEGFNVQRLAYGDAQAKESTVSFWHKHTKTGTQCVTIQTSGGGKWTSKQYTQSVSNTWEYATVTIPGDTATAPANDSAARLDIMFGVSVGSTYTSGSEAAWGTTNGDYFPGQVNNMDSTSNNFEIAGVQWEVGSVATDFAHEDYGTTLWKCYRYFWRFQANTASGQKWMLTGLTRSTTSSRYACPMQTEMRATPTLTSSSGTTSDIYDGVVQIATDAIALQAGTPGGVQIQVDFGGSGTAGNATGWLADNGATFDFSAEL